MGWGYGGFAPYESVASRRIKNQKKIIQLKAKNPHLCPIVTPEKGKFSSSWWGMAWNKNLESYSDFSNRLERGRSYLRTGAVLDLQIGRGELKGLVQGSMSKPYEVKISISPVEGSYLSILSKKLTDTVASIADLLLGKFPEPVGKLLLINPGGLFPEPKQIKFKCSCPDGAYMCKHVAAVLYGVSVRLDVSPGLFFELRQIEMNKLVSKVLSDHVDAMVGTAGPSKNLRGKKFVRKSVLKDRKGNLVTDQGSSSVSLLSGLKSVDLDPEELSALFGIETQALKKSKLRKSR